MTSATARSLSFVVSLEGRVHVVGVDSEKEAHRSVEEHLDAVMDELVCLSAHDPSIQLDLSTWEVAFSVLVDAPNPVEATTLASAQLRSAVHAAGGATPDWPGPYDEAWAVQLIRVVSEPVADDPDADDDRDEDSEGEFAVA